MKPIYTHDCSHCTFLGTVSEPDGQQYDLYHHSSSFEDTVIARFGSEGPDYSSGAGFSYSGMSPLLTIARLRAQQKGLMKYSIEQGLCYAQPGTYCHTELIDALSKTAVPELMQAIRAQNNELALNVWNSLDAEESLFIRTHLFDLLKIYSITDYFHLTRGVFAEFQREINDSFFQQSQ